MTVRFDGDRLPEWHEASGNYLDPGTGELLPTWDQALDSIGPHDQPRHVARFGPKFDAQGVLAGSKDSGRCIKYLTKYLTKHLSGCHQADTGAQADHADRLIDALRYEPCSPGCANWLRYGIQPKDAREGLRPGACKGKAHRREHLGYAGRRVLVSRKWSGKTLADHRGDRKAWLMATLDLPRRRSAATAGNPSAPVMRTSCRTAGGSCTSSPTAPDGKPPSPKPGEKPRKTPAIFRQPGGRRDKQENRQPGRAAAHRGAGRRPAGTSERFPRRLIAERRIRFVRLGRHVRIPTSAVGEFIAAGAVEPVKECARGRPRAA